MIDLVETDINDFKVKHYEVIVAYGVGDLRRQDRKPDLIVLDVMMPDKDGYTVARAKPARSLRDTRSSVTAVVHIDHHLATVEWRQG